MLYTGDEMGFMIKWDISSVVEKLALLTPIEQEDENSSPEAKKVASKKATFFTGLNDETSKIKFGSDDIILIQRWKAHEDLINQVSFVPELGVIASCSFDCNVYMWDKETLKQCGSLVLGTGSASSNEISQFEKNKYAKIWQIKIDKKSRFINDCNEAGEMLE